MLIKSLLVNTTNKNVIASANKCCRHAWEAPKGFPTRIKMYNCVARSSQPLIVRNINAVTWYTCGPTVYDSAHIGHASCYVKLDIIQRILKEHFRLNIVTVMNVTDIDDKIIKQAKQKKVDYKEISTKYEDEFWNDLILLKVPKPDLILRVTENMQLIIDFIIKLLNQKQAYISSDNSVYFDVKSVLTQYGKLQNLGESFEDPWNPHKKCPMDFALWKSRKSEDEPFWESPWGKGRPGWHIECSALASHVFGNNLDIHAGGIDLRFPHHENEEIQSCGFYGSKQWVNYWIHVGHLHLKESEKMSKSLKNTISIQDLLTETSPNVFRLACALSHYSSRIEFSKQWLETASNLYKTFRNFNISINEVEKGFLKVKLDSELLEELLQQSVENIDAALCNDFNTPQVIEVLCRIVSVCNSMIVRESSDPLSYNGDLHYLLALYNLVKKTLDLFNVTIDDPQTVSNSDDATKFIDILVNFRRNVRELGLTNKNKDLLKICDNIRDSLGENGVMIKDIGKLSSWSKQ